MQLSFEIEGEKQLSRRLRIISTGVKNWRPQMGKVGRYLVDVFSGTVFDTKGRAIGEPWVKRKQTYPWPILERSGRMRGSFRHKASSVQVAIYNTADYFKFHQSKKPRAKLPRRIMMKLDSQRKTAIVRIFQQRLIKLLQQRV